MISTCADADKSAKNTILLREKLDFSLHILIFMEKFVN